MREGEPNNNRMLCTDQAKLIYYTIGALPDSVSVLPAPESGEEELLSVQPVKS